MSMSSRQWLTVILWSVGTAALLLLVWYIAAGCYRINRCPVFEGYRTKGIKTFEDCAARGFPVMESYPRQCRAGQITYVERVTVPQHPDVRVSNISPNQVISSPFTVVGQARGRWYFEASFPVEVTDVSGVSLGIVPAQAQGEWMTDDFVPFSVTVTFSQPSTPTGLLILHKDNPSGLPQHDDQLIIPIRFGAVNVYPELH